MTITSIPRCVRPLGALAVLLALQGCQGFYLHNPERAVLAANARKQIDSVDVNALTKTETENIARITTEEIKVVEERQKQAAQLAVMQISLQDSSVASHYARAIGRMQSRLGTSSLRDLQLAGDCRINRQVDIEQVSVAQERFEALGLEKAPACTANMPATLAPPAELDAALHARFAGNYKDLKTVCEAVAKGACGLLDRDGELVSAEAAAIRRRDEAKQAREALKEARRAYEEAVAANKKSTDAAAKKEEDLRGKAQNILDQLDKLAKVAPSEADRIRAGSLVDLLTAAASGTAPEGESGASVEIAKSVPALAGSIAQARAASAQVPVSHLLLALNNELILAERDDRLADLDAEELSALRRKVAVREHHAKLYRAYNDNLCKLVLAAASKPVQGGSCDTIIVPKQPAAAPFDCTVKRLEDKDPVVVNNCVLAKSWRELFQQTPGGPAARRYLHEAAAAFLQLRLTAYQTTQEEFRRIDVDHRRTVVQREASLAQWKNVVVVPAGELEAYYAGGTKPEEIADLLVKALGLTAIAIGVAQ